MATTALLRALRHRGAPPPLPWASGSVRSCSNSRLTQAEEAGRDAVGSSTDSSSPCVPSASPRTRGRVLQPPPRPPARSDASIGWQNALLAKQAKHGVPMDDSAARRQTAWRQAFEAHLKSQPAERELLPRGLRAPSERSAAMLVGQAAKAEETVKPTKERVRRSWEYHGRLRSLLPDPILEVIETNRGKPLDFQRARDRVPEDQVIIYESKGDMIGLPFANVSKTLTACFGSALAATCLTVYGKFYLVFVGWDLPAWTIAIGLFDLWMFRRIYSLAVITSRTTHFITMPKANEMPLNITPTTPLTFYPITVAGPKIYDFFRPITLQLRDCVAEGRLTSKLLKGSRAAKAGVSEAPIGAVAELGRNAWRYAIKKGTWGTNRVSSPAIRSALEDVYPFRTSNRVYPWEYKTLADGGKWWEVALHDTKATFYRLRGSWRRFRGKDAIRRRDAEQLPSP